MGQIKLLIREEDFLKDGPHKAFILPHLGRLIAKENVIKKINKRKEIHGKNKAKENQTTQQSNLDDGKPV